MTCGVNPRVDGELNCTMSAGAIKQSCAPSGPRLDRQEYQALHDAKHQHSSHHCWTHHARFLHHLCNAQRQQYAIMSMFSCKSGCILFEDDDSRSNTSKRSLCNPIGNTVGLLQAIMHCTIF